jgi:hypothetical protein
MFPVGDTAAVERLDDDFVGLGEKELNDISYSSLTIDTTSKYQSNSASRNSPCLCCLLYLTIDDEHSSLARLAVICPK